MEEQEGTAHHIDVEPTLFLGCGSSELLTLAVVGAVVGIVFGILVAILTGVFLLVLPFPVLVAMIAVYSGGKRLGKAKEGKPDGYYDRLIATKFATVPVISKVLGFNGKYVIRTGHWRNRR
jgi:conjugative transfer region protein (TIGR03750 family)